MKIKFALYKFSTKEEDRKPVSIVFADSWPEVEKYIKAGYDRGGLTKQAVETIKLLEYNRPFIEEIESFRDIFDIPEKIDYLAFKNNPNDLCCKFIIGPAKDGEIREKILKIAQKDPILFNQASGKAGSQFKTIQSEDFFENYEDKTSWTEEDVRRELENKFSVYKEKIEEMAEKLCAGLDVIRK